MAGITLYDYQMDAVRRMKNGCILCGGVGSGKSRMALAYYYVQNGGVLNTDEYILMDDVEIKDLYIITTARKRDTADWEKESVPFHIGPNDMYDHIFKVDSWNNIQKYKKVKNAFFIFDEQRVVGCGKWSKAFIEIAKHNEWILLSATPGDKWTDYMSVFIANGFYKGITDFERNHIIYKRILNHREIDRIYNTRKLVRLRDSILIDVPFKRDTISHDETIICDYERTLYRQINHERWNIFKNKPIENPSEHCMALRTVVNSDETRSRAVLEIFEKHSKIIIFYNYDFELDILKSLEYGNDVQVAEWNGHKHQEIPDCERWVYLVNYNAGAEGWNCIKTDTIVFYSQNYSYKVVTQAKGRIDRLNTPFRDLYYYTLKSRSPIDNAISKALANKKKFNESRFSRNVI